VLRRVAACCGVLRRVAACCGVFGTCILDFVFSDENKILYHKDKQIKIKTKLLHINFKIFLKITK
jgi:hypothetical protein